MIYHYTSEKGLLGILNSKSIWLVSSKEMSDISDRFYGNLFATIALLKSNDENVKLLRNHLTEKDILEVNMESFEVQFYSASFCKRNDNDYLWENYADSNKGVAIEINDQILESYFISSIKDNYYSLDGDEIPVIKNDLIETRKVIYDYPVSDFDKIVSILRPDDYCLDNNKKSYKDWFLFTVCVLAGMVKAKNFDKEEELRLLFQNRYSDEYISKHSMFSLFKEEYKKVLSSLGIDEEKNGIKRRMELKLDNVFSSTLIPTIIIGDEYTGNLETLRNYLIDLGLDRTKIRNRRGKAI